MDTKVEQEVFGLDMSNPDGLDDLLDHIHDEEVELTNED
ncbi:hypothetical protein phiV141_13 [Vibrio phage phiV141]|uniref:Uncharacterized protein n=1 Tax=Vibrio phage phiV141 TaxID=2723905 RepID=A0A7D7IB81_9CAUD|nr:hypothetical protein phiV141_13 [Vibrio phage phiV141]